jgi:hypothetical protein
MFYSSSTITSSAISNVALTSSFISTRLLWTLFQKSGRAGAKMDRAGFEPASISLSNSFGFDCLFILIPVLLLLFSSYKLLEKPLHIKKWELCCFVHFSETDDCTFRFVNKHLAVLGGQIGCKCTQCCHPMNYF